MTKKAKPKEIYSTIPVAGKLHVLVAADYRGDKLPQPNYYGTGKALAGVLEKGQSLSEWIKCKEKKGRAK